jgi:hypothetical protein
VTKAIAILKQDPSNPSNGDTKSEHTNALTKKSDQDQREEKDGGASETVIGLDVELVTDTQ